VGGALLGAGELASCLLEEIHCECLMSWYLI
jgi:hypothetical protein